MRYCHGKYQDELFKPGVFRIAFTDDGELLVFRQREVPREQSNPIPGSNDESKSIQHNQQLPWSMDEYDSDDEYDPYSRVSTPDIYSAYEWD